MRQNIPKGARKVDSVCFRCRRVFLAGERIIEVFAGPVEVFYDGWAIRAENINTFTQHENIDDCTKGR